MTNAVTRAEALASPGAGPHPRPMTGAPPLAAGPLLALALLLAGGAPAPAPAATRAVLVGVSDYLHLDADLAGPVNDVRLMAEVLAARGIAPEAMTVLTSDPAGLPDGVVTGAPLRAEILAALDDAAAGAGPGDTVVFYFSGHGSRAPDLSGDEGGGNDEIFLPADAGQWNGAVGAVENAIIDDELNLWAARVLGQGARLVGLIDACHSDTGFRALGAAGVARSIDEGLLAIPGDVVSAPAPAPGDQPPGLTGEFVFLYSSQADERSYEYPLGETGLWHGEFTLRLAQALAQAPDATWGQVLATAADAMVRGPARQEPAGEGPLLSARVFGEGSGEARFRLDGTTLRAGLLQGVDAGAGLALFAAGAGGEPIGEAVVRTASAREARLAGPLPEGAAWAELVAAPPPPPLVLAAAQRADAGDGLDYSGWLAALAALPGPGLEDGTGTGAGTGADLVPILVDGTVALARADGALDPAGPGSTPRVVPQEGETPAQALARALETAGHGLRLRETLAGATGRSLTGKEPLSVAIARRAALPSGGGGCGAPGPAEPWDPAAGVAPCDQLWLTVTNVSGKAQDVSVLYMAADFAVQPIWPRANLSNRLAPGEHARIGLAIEAAPGASAGQEEIWVLAVPADGGGAARTDLTRLAEPAASRDTGGAGPMLDWLEARLGGDGESLDRGFSLKPAALAMIRRTVRLKPPIP